MLQINGIGIKNYIIYEKAMLHLDPGITTIRGKNLDRKSSKASNGSGKSILPGVIPGIFYDAAPLPMKSKKNPKEGFKKGTELNLSVTDRFNNKLDIKKYFHGTVKLDVIKNKKPLKFRKKTDAKERINKILPLNEDQFYSLVYLDTKRSPVFQYGTDAQRHHFIESLYKLNIYDKMAERVKKDWDKNKTLIQELELIDRQLSQKLEEKPGDPQELSEKKEALVKKVENLRDRVSFLIKKVQECRTFETLSDGLDFSKTIEELKEEEAEIVTNNKACKKQLDTAYKNNQSYEAYKTAKELKTNLKKKLDKVKDVKIDKSVQETLREDKSLLDNIETQKIENARIDRELESLTALKFSLSDKNKEKALAAKVSALEKALVQERTKLKELKEDLEKTEEHLSEDHSNGSCPVCSSILNPKMIKQLIKERREAIEKLSLNVDKIKEMVRYARTSSDIKRLEGERVKLEDASKVKKRIKINEELLQSMRRKILLTSQLKDLPDVKPVTFMDTVELENEKAVLEERLAQIRTRIDKLENLDKLKLPFKSMKQAKREKRDYEAQLEEYRPLLDKLQSKMHNLTTSLSRSELLVKDIQNLSTQVEGLKLKTGNYKILSSLRKAFGAKGIRRQRVAQIGLAIEDSLNSYAKMLFDFPIKFQLVITDTKFQILAHRNGIISDVRSLSGAESRYFSLLTLVALLPFCPLSQRVDIVILDEIEANLDESFRQRYVSIFLPELLKVVPKVLIVTPLDEKSFYIPKCHSYVVTKKNGKSTLAKVA